MEPAEELKKCPKCGEEGDLTTNDYVVIAYCMSCGCETKQFPFDDHTGCKKAWNRGDVG